MAEQDKPIVDIPSAIMALPVPQTFNFTFARSYGGAETGVFGPALSDGNLSWSDLGNSESWKTFLAKAVQAGLGSSAEAAVQAGFKISVNNRQEVIFQDLPFRDVSLAWTLKPRSKEKAARYLEAIDFMKVRSAPQLKESDALWDLSDCYFTLELKPGGDERILMYSQEMVITNINVDYSPNGFWSQHTDGMPTQINLTINMMETELAFNPGGDAKKLRGTRSGADLT